MKAVLSETELRESIRLALMKSLVLEGDEVNDAPKTFDDKLADIGRELRKENVANVMINTGAADEPFQFEEIPPVAGYLQSSPLYSSQKGAVVEKVQNNPKFRDALTELIANSDSIDKFFVDLNSSSLDKNFAISVAGGSDTAPSGMFFMVDKNLKKIIAIHPVFSPKTIASYIVGARQKSLRANADGKPFPGTIEKMISALVPGKEEK